MLAVTALLLGLSACGGGGDSGSMELAVAQGNAGQIRKEFDEAVGRGAPDRSSGNGVTTAAAAGSGSGTESTAVSASPLPAGGAAESAAGNGVGTGPEAASDAPAAEAGPAASAVPGADDPVAIAFRDASLAALNAARAVARRCGDREMPAVGPVRWNARVAYAALLESEWMIDRNSFGHAWENGELVWDRLVMAGYLWQAADENIAAGFDTLADAMHAWLESPAHCVALMRADIEEAGIAVLPGRAGSRYSSYWTMALGTPRRMR